MGENSRTWETQRRTCHKAGHSGTRKGTASSDFRKVLKSLQVSGDGGWGKERRKKAFVSSFPGEKLGKI